MRVHVLPAGNWDPENRAWLETWLERVARRDFETRPVAVFDWDNTCTFNDVGELVLRYQLDHLALRFTPEALAEFIPEEVNGQGTLPGGVSLADLRADLLAAYAELRPHIEAGDIEAARALPAHRDFRAKAAWLYDTFYDTENIGAEFNLIWLVGWTAGHNRAEVRELVERTIAETSAQTPGRETWTSASEGRAGQREYSFTTGYCRHDEIRDLMAAMIRVGIEVYVVSASGELIVEAAASILEFPVGPETIYGIRTIMEGDVVTIGAPDVSTYPVTYRQGKVDLIRRELGQDPIFVAGDANTDYEMLSLFPGTEVRLVINRLKFDADIGRLYRGAYEPRRENNPVTLLQGRNENRCSFHPMRETIRLGEERPTPMPGYR